jgi:hypothetical protein
VTGLYIVVFCDIGRGTEVYIVLYCDGKFVIGLLILWY